MQITCLFPRSETTSRVPRRHRPHKFHAALAQPAVEGVGLSDVDGQTLGMEEIPLEGLSVIAAQNVLVILALDQRRMSYVVVEELTPLHQEQREVPAGGVSIGDEGIADRASRRKITFLSSRT